MRISLEREEALAGAIALASAREPSGWSKSALKKLDKALKRTRKRSSKQ